MSVNDKKLKVNPKITEATVIDSAKISLCWTAVPGADKYCVKRSETPDGEYEIIRWTTETSYTDADVKKDVTYWYNVVAVKILKRKRTSKKTSPTVAAIISDIPSPCEVAVAPVGQSAIRLSWKSPLKGCTFIINRRNDFFDQIIPIGRVERTKFIDKDVTSGQVYHYSVQSLLSDEDGCREGNFSEQVSCICLDCGQIIQAKTAAFGRVYIQVRIVAGADGYILERSTDKENFREVGRTSSGTDLRFRDKADKMFATYYYRTRAYKLIDGEEFISKSSETVKIRTR